MAGFVLVRFCFWVKLKAPARVKSSGNRTPVGFRERRRALIETYVVDCMVAVTVKLC